MSDDVGAGSCQKFRSRLLRARQHKRCSAENGTKKDLETAITANIVKRTPDNLPSRFTSAFHCPSQALQCVHNQLRQSRRSRGKEDPLRLVLCRPVAAPWSDLSIAGNK